MLKLLFLALMFVFVLLTFVPALPSLVVVYGLGVLYGLIKGWHAVGTSFLVVGGILLALSFVGEYYLKAWGAKRFGGTKAGAWGAVIGGIVGAFFFPIGLIAGPFLGAFLAEIVFSGMATEQAVRVGWGSVIGVITGVVGNFVLGLIMFVWFLFSASW
jgi:uncharacterized protein YqgC (DUF456 family)